MSERTNYPADKAEALRCGYDIRRKVVQGGFFCCNYGTEMKERLPEVPKELWDVYLSSDKEPPPAPRQPPQPNVQEDSSGNNGNASKRMRIGSTSTATSAWRASSHRSHSSNSNSVSNGAGRHASFRQYARPSPVPVLADDDDDDDDDALDVVGTSSAASVPTERRLCWRHFSFN